MWRVFLLILIFIGLGAFALHAHASSLFITAAVGIAAVLMNVYLPLKNLSWYIVFGSLFYAGWQSVELALRLYF